MGEEPTQTRRVQPQSELDFHLMTTDSVWGKNDINKDLQEKLRKYFVEKKIGENGTEEDVVTHESLWGLLGFYTRDMRLANLSFWNGEVTFCQYYLDLANDFLQCNQIEPFLICLSRVATMLELSQSKNGFLRKQMNTLTTQSLHGELEPAKKKLFGDNKKTDGRM